MDYTAVLAIPKAEARLPVRKARPPRASPGWFPVALPRAPKTTRLH